MLEAGLEASPDVRHLVLDVRRHGHFAGNPSITPRQDDVGAPLLRQFLRLESNGVIKTLRLRADLPFYGLVLRCILITGFFNRWFRRWGCRDRWRCCRWRWRLQSF